MFNREIHATTVNGADFRGRVVKCDIPTFVCEPTAKNITVRFRINLEERTLKSLEQNGDIRQYNLESLVDTEKEDNLLEYNNNELQSLLLCPSAHSVEVKLDELLYEVRSTDKYLTIRNPKNKRIVHVMNQDKEEKRLVGQGNKFVHTSHCKSFELTRPNRIGRNFSDLQEIVSKEELQDRDDICKNCLKKI